MWEEISSWTEQGLPVVTIAGRMGLAALLGLLVGIERERREHAAGMRTHAVVSVASALMIMVSTYGFPLGDKGDLDPSRIAAQVVSGIGFLGAGVIIFRKNVIHGLTTAASVWAVSGIGLAAGGGMAITATIGTGFLLLIQGGLRPVKQRLFQETSRHHTVVLTVSGSKGVLKGIRKVAMGNPGFDLLSMEFEDATDEAPGRAVINLMVHDPDDTLMIIQQLKDISGVVNLTWEDEGNNGSHEQDQRHDLYDREEL